MGSSAAPVIAVAGLTKRYTDVLAVHNVGLSLQAGQIYTLLGLNGAGKTTLIRMLLGMIAPTAGSARVLGTVVSAGQHSARQRLTWGRTGYLVEAPAAYPELTVAENLHLCARLRQLKHPGRHVEDIIERLALTPYAGRRARTLSMGNL